MHFHSIDIVAPNAVSKSRKHSPWIAFALCTLAAIAIVALVAPSSNQAELPVALKSKAPKSLLDVNADLASMQDDLNNAISDLNKAVKAAAAKAAASTSKKAASTSKKAASKSKKAASKSKKAASKSKKAASKSKKAASKSKKAKSTQKKAPLTPSQVQIAKLKAAVLAKRQAVKKALATKNALEKLTTQADHKSKPIAALIAVASAQAEVEEAIYSVALKTPVAKKASSALESARAALLKAETALSKASKSNFESLKKAVSKAIVKVDTARFKKAAAEDDLSRAAARLDTANRALALAKKSLK